MSLAILASRGTAMTDWPHPPSSHHEHALPWLEPALRVSVGATRQAAVRLLTRLPALALCPRSLAGAARKEAGAARKEAGAGHECG